ncbi:MAG TPA: phosphatase PAP2 family protein [Solirubrobacteraceae bacterium]|nr:phosphatase PAP2 family protein [Solirubrobacteraceae bacterium]
MDWSIAHALNSFLARNDVVEDPLLLYVQASEALFLGMLVAVIALARHAAGASIRRAAAAAGLSAALALLVGKLITEVYDRPRPFVAHPGQVHLFISHAADASFPSDHATAAAAIAVAILLRSKLRWGAVVMLFTVILMFGRVALGFHYPTDVIGGALIGALAALYLWTRPARSLIDTATDRAGGWWDQGLDAALRIPRRFARASQR